MHDLQTTNHREQLLYDNEISYRQIFLYIENKHQCNLFTMCSLINRLFTATGNNNTIYSKHRIDNRHFDSKLPIIVFQISLIKLIESEKKLEKHRISTFLQTLN